MATHNPDNERIKRLYFAFLKEAKGLGVPAVDDAAKALARFEAFTKCREFRGFQIEQAIAFKRRLAEQLSETTGARLSKATVHATLGHLKRFFQWLSDKPGYKSRFRYSDAEFFNASEKDARIASARRDRPSPTMEQLKHTISVMPTGTEIERRDRAVVAFVLLTGVRDGALASMKLRHVDLVTGTVDHDARQVKTKNGKSFVSDFFPVGEEIREIVAEWVTHLRVEKLWGNDDPLFPATHVAPGIDHQFEADGLDRKHWRTATPIRRIFSDAFIAAGLPYFNPHSVRKTLTRLGQSLCVTPEDYKAWSQNLGHDAVLTTFSSYGSVGRQRQREIIQSLAKPRQVEMPGVADFAKAVARELLDAGRGGSPIAGQPE